jgi:hypothetical protein
MKRIKSMMLALLLPAIALAHSGGRDIKGTIVKVDRGSIVVKRVDGQSETVVLTPGTTYRIGQVPGRWEDLRAGLRVVVHLGHDGKAIEVHLPARK